MIFRPDGKLYVASRDNANVLRYNASTGAFLDVFIPSRSAGTVNQVTRYSATTDSVFRVSLSSPWPSTVTVNCATANGSAVAGSDYVAASGTITFAPSQMKRTIAVQTIDDMTYESTETFFVNLSNTVGARIATGQGIGTILDNEAPVAVVGTNLLYNNSYFDGNTSGATNGDDAAQATGKVPLRIGTATLANCTNYSRGINGLMVDVANLAGTVTADDFQFRVGNTDTPATWVAAPNPTQVTIRAGSGANGSSRVTLVWPDNAIEKTWLQVTVRANANTGLLTPDVFYFGNAIGDVGDSSTNAIVNATDIAAVVSNQNNFLNPALITSPYDFNHDRQINATDIAIAVANQTSFLNALRLISLPAGGSGARIGSIKGAKGSGGSDTNETVSNMGAFGQAIPLFAMGLIAPASVSERQPRSSQKADELLYYRNLNWPVKLTFESSRVNETIAAITDDKDHVKTNDRENDFKASIDAVLTDLGISLSFIR